LRLRRISAELSLLVFTLNGMASYLAEYPSIYTSRQWIHVFVGILVGRVIGAVRSVFNRPSQLTCLGLGVLVAMISILNVTALTALKGMPRFQYRGETRLSGAFLDPNMLGLLMGCGLVLALGCAALISEGDERPFGWA